MDEFPEKYYGVISHPKHFVANLRKLTQIDAWPTDKVKRPSSGRRLIAQTSNQRQHLIFPINKITFDAQIIYFWSVASLKLVFLPVILYFNYFAGKPSWESAHCAHCKVHFCHQLKIQLEIWLHNIEPLTTNMISFPICKTRLLKFHVWSWWHISYVLQNSAFQPS